MKAAADKAAADKAELDAANKRMGELKTLYSQTNDDDLRAKYKEEILSLQGLVFKGDKLAAERERVLAEEAAFLAEEARKEAAAAKALQKAEEAKVREQTNSVDGWKIERK